MTITSKQYLSLLIKRPLTKEAAMNPLLELGLYMSPVTGELMSLKDAGVNVFHFGQKVRDKDYRGAGWEALKGVGNLTMAGAGLIPGGPLVRGYIKGKRLAKGGKGVLQGLTGAVKGTNRIDDGLDLARAATSGRQPSYLIDRLKRYKKPGAAKDLARKGADRILNARNVDELSDIAGYEARKLKNMGKNLPLWKKNYWKHRKTLNAQRKLTQAAQSTEGYARGALRQYPKGVRSLRGTEGAIQGAMVGGLARRASPRQLKAWDHLSRVPLFKSYLRAQGYGFGTVAAANVPEQYREQLKIQRAKLDEQEAQGKRDAQAKQNQQLTNEYVKQFYPQQ